MKMFDEFGEISSIFLSINRQNKQKMIDFGDISYKIILR